MAGSVASTLSLIRLDNLRLEFLRRILVREDEHDKALPEDAGDEQEQTQAFSAYQPPPPPRWSAPAPASAPRAGGRRHGRMVIGLGLAVVVVVGGAVGTVALIQSNDPAAAAEPAPAAAPAAGYDLRKGAVFLQSNDATENKIVAFARNVNNGTVREIGRFKTGGTGSGTFEDSAKGLILGTAEGEASPNHLVDKGEYLFTSNAGSNTISVFRVQANGLDLVTQVPSGGEKPVSLTVSHGLLYVLNSGEYDDRFIVGPQELGPAAVLDNCTHGQLPSVTGFKVGSGGTLTQINGSTRPLSGEKASGCSEAALTPDGKTLVVTERIGGKKDAAGTNKGDIVTYPVRADGTLGAMGTIVPSGNGPFGFTFTKDGTLLTTEQNGPNPGGGHVASYSPGPDGSFQPNGGSVANSATDTCWIVVTNDGKLAFASSAMAGGTISSFSLGRDGTPKLLHEAASADDGKNPMADKAGDGLTDLSLSRDSKYLYQLNSIFGLLYVFQVNANGTLTYVEEHQVFNLELPFQGGQLTPFGLTAF
jgi:6-phosphogluconolactonase